MSPNTPRASDEQIIALLRAGVSHRQITAQLHVGKSRITGLRQRAGIPPAPSSSRGRSRYKSSDERRAAVEQRHPRVAAMLRDGATYAQITTATSASPCVIADVRRTLGIPVPHGRDTSRTIPEAIAHHLEPHDDGHARWNGPHSNGQPQLWAQGRVYSARREIYRHHHGRAPQGRVRATCTEPGCLGPEHLADDTDRQYTAIFGPDTP